MNKPLIGIVMTIVWTTACGGAEKPAAPPPAGAGGMPAMAVQVVALEPKPVEQSTEFVGTVKSRRSTNVQSQVEGFITRIAVKSGDRVAAGAPLMEIDSRLQEAAIASLMSVKAQRDIDVTYARQEADRAQKLLAAGAASQMDEARAANTLKAAEAQVKTVQEQIRQLETDLAYYHLTAPTAGIVGDIPVHEGDRVTKTTPLTTIDSNAGLELYLNIPVHQAPQLRLGLPVRLLDVAGAPMASRAINFIAPSVDGATQTVLAKVPLDASGGLRTDQYVRALVIWSTAPTLTAPVTSMVRINGQFFVFVAEQGEGGALVARQRAVVLGPVIGNEYVVASGLSPGDRLIVSGVQKIGDGAPVRADASAPAAPAASAVQGGR